MTQLADPSPPEPRVSLSLADIEAAADRIAGHVERTPCLQSRTLSELTGAEVWLKFENLQYTASFKERGALNKLAQLTEDERRRGVVAMSAGNHGQGIAYHARRLGIAATIIMPETTPFIKIESTRKLGADVELSGEGVDEAAAHARRLVDERGLVFVHPFDDPAIIAGQGTVALEMMATGSFDDVLVPVGGGGLLAGMALAAASLAPRTRMIGVETALYPVVAARLSGRSDGAIGGPTIAEGIAVKQPGALTLPLIKRFANTVLLVDEDDLEASVLLLLEIEKTVVEGAGAAGLAALLRHPREFVGRRVGIVLSGGNIDMRLLSGVILRGLVRSERLVRLRIGLPDSPGSLVRVASVIAQSAGNVVDVAHQRAFSQRGVKEADVDFTIETRDASHAATLLLDLERAGFRAERLTVGRS